MKESNFILDKQSKNDEQVVDFIIEVVKGFYNCIDNYHIIKSRKREIVKPRQIAMYLSFINTSKKMTYERLAEIFKKDHTTVLHAKKTIEGYLDVDLKFKKEIKELNKVVNFKKGALNENISFFKKYHYIDLNNFTSIETLDNKGIILTGFDKEQESEIIRFIDKIKSLKRFTKTGRYILEKK